MDDARHAPPPLGSHRHDQAVAANGNHRVLERVFRLRGPHEGVKRLVDALEGGARLTAQRAERGRGVVHHLAALPDFGAYLTLNPAQIGEKRGELRHHGRDSFGGCERAARLAMHFETRRHRQQLIPAQRPPKRRARDGFGSVRAGFQV